MMSGFHGMCSLGGLIGVMSVTALLAFGVTPFVSIISISMILVLIGLLTVPYALSAHQQKIHRRMIVIRVLIQLKNVPLYW